MRPNGNHSGIELSHFSSTNSILFGYKPAARNVGAGHLGTNSSLLKYTCFINCFIFYFIVFTTSLLEDKLTKGDNVTSAIVDVVVSFRRKGIHICTGSFTTQIHITSTVSCGKKLCDQTGHPDPEVVVVVGKTELPFQNVSFYNQNFPFFDISLILVSLLVS